MSTLGRAQIEWSSVSSQASLHPGQAAVIELDGAPIGSLGVLHPRVARHFNLAQLVIVFELELEKMSPIAVPSFTPISKFPSVRRDISIVIDQEIPAGQVLRAVRLAAGDLLRDLQLFDEYRGQGIDSDKKSLAMGLIFQAHSSTLTDDEVENILQIVLERIASEVGGALRE